MRKMSEFVKFGRATCMSTLLWCAVLRCFSHVQLFSTPWTVAFQALLSMGFSRQEYWSELPFPSPGDLPHPGFEPGLVHCRPILYQLSHQGSPDLTVLYPIYLVDVSLTCRILCPTLRAPRTDVFLSFFCMSGKGQVVRAAQSLLHSFIPLTNQLRVYSEPAINKGGVASALRELTVCRGSLT